MPEYRVRIINSGTTTFVASAEITWRDLERVHRTNLAPAVLAAVVREITMVLRLQPGGAEDPAAVRSAFAAFMSAHMSQRTVPTSFQILDPSNVPIPDLGEITDAGSPPAWTEIQITGFEAGTTVPQFKAWAEFTLTVQGRRSFPDANGIEACEQTFSRSADADNLLVERLISTCRLDDPDLDFEALPAATLDAFRLPSPPGTIRLAPANRTPLGFSISFPEFPLRHIVEIESAVKVLGGGFILPEGAGDGSLVTSFTVDPRAGLVRRTTRQEITGSADPLTFANAGRPTGGVGRVEHDRARNTATGEWLTREESLFISGKVVRVRITWSLDEGGRPVSEAPIVGGFNSILRKGHFIKFKLTETVEAFALGPEVLNDLPLPQTLPEPWLFNPGGSTWTPPEIAEYSDLTDGFSQHYWRTGTTRRYIWDATTDPREDSENQTIFMEQFLRTTAVRTLVPPEALRV